MATYISIGLTAFLLAGVVAILLIRQQRAAERVAAPKSSDVAAPLLPGR